MEGRATLAESGTAEGTIGRMNDNAGAAPVRAVLFDLGGVVVHVDVERSLAAWARHSRLSPTELRDALRIDDRWHGHETGALTDDDFFAHLRERLALTGDAEAVRAGWNAMLVAEIDETVAMLEAIRPGVPRYAISNTNPAHVAEMERAFPGLLARFDAVFVSHEIGHRKPGREAFEHVLRAIDVPAPQVLLFDDLVANVEAARACGMQAVQVRGPEDVREGLRVRGLLTRR
jgi:glucose-1-phosphatase